MMDVSVFDMIERLEALEKSLPDLVAESVTETGEAYTRSNAAQMTAGRLNDDTPIEPEYAESTRHRKKAKGQPYDRVTLEDSRDFKDTFRLKVSGDDMELSSDVDYEKYIEKRYSKKIWGLAPARNETYAFGPFWKVLQTKIETATLLKFD